MSAIGGRLSALAVKVTIPLHSNRIADRLLGLSDMVRDVLEKFDDWLREEGHTRNPGTTADLVAACLWVALHERIVPPNALFCCSGATEARTDFP